MLLLLLLLLLPVPALFFFFLLLVCRLLSLLFPVLGTAVVVRLEVVVVDAVPAPAPSPLAGLAVPARIRGLVHGDGKDVLGPPGHAEKVRDPPAPGEQGRFPRPHRAAVPHLGAPAGPHSHPPPGRGGPGPPLQGDRDAGLRAHPDVLGVPGRRRAVAVAVAAAAAAAVAVPNGRRVVSQVAGCHLGLEQIPHRPAAVHALRQQVLVDGAAPEGNHGAGNQGDREGEEEAHGPGQGGAPVP